MHCNCKVKQFVSQNTTMGLLAKSSISSNNNYMFRHALDCLYSVTITKMIRSEHQSAVMLII